MNTGKGRKRVTDKMWIPNEQKLRKSKTNKGKNNKI